jgi:hypothetical protein
MFQSVPIDYQEFIRNFTFLYQKDIYWHLTVNITVDEEENCIPHKSQVWNN